MNKGKTTRDYLQDIIDYLDKAAAFTSAGKEAFYADEMAQLAVIRVYEVIGEIAKRLPSDWRDSNTQIDWRKLAGFRDFLSHNYNEIILAFIWQAIDDLPVLRAAVQALLDTMATDG